MSPAWSDLTRQVANSVCATFDRTIQVECEITPCDDCKNIESIRQVANWSYTYGSSKYIVRSAMSLSDSGMGLSDTIPRLLLSLFYVMGTSRKTDTQGLSRSRPINRFVR